MHGERAAIKVEVGAETIVHHGEHLLAVLLIIARLMVHVLLTGPLTTAIHEDVLLTRVSVEVAVELDLAALQGLPHHLLDGKRLRK